MHIEKKYTQNYNINRLRDIKYSHSKKKDKESIIYIEVILLCENKKHIKRRKTNKPNKAKKNNQTRK